MEGEAFTYAAVLRSDVIPRPRSLKLQEKLSRIRHFRRLLDNNELTGSEFVLSIAEQMVSGQIYSTNDAPDVPQVEEAFEVDDLADGEDAVNMFERWRGFDGVNEASSPVDHQSYAGRTFYDADFAFFEVLSEFKQRQMTSAELQSPIYWREVVYEPNSSNTESCQQMVSGFLDRYKQCVGKDLLRPLKLSLMNETDDSRTIDLHGVYAQVTFCHYIFTVVIISHVAPLDFHVPFYRSPQRFPII